MSHRLSFFILLVPIISVCLFAQQGVQPQITTPSLPQGQQGNIYGEAFTATGGTAPYSWSISVGTPPTGIVMNTNGNFVGIPTTAGHLQLHSLALRMPITTPLRAISA